MTGPLILTLTTFLPLAGALVILALRIVGGATMAGSASKGIALLTSLGTLAVSIVALNMFLGDTSGDQYLLVDHAPWFGGSSYKLGVDGMAIALVVLTTALTPLCILQSMKSIEDRLAEYMICFLVLEALMIGVFCAMDLILFYVFFEGGLIPMFLIIGVWGGKNRLYAAFKFFLYTLLGSLLMLVAIIYMIQVSGSADFDVRGANYRGIRSLEVQTWLWLAFFASFAVKLPMWPVHTWLPDAHVRGADCRLGHPCRRAAEDGRLRLPAFLAADVSGRESLLFQPLHVRPGCGGDRLHLARRVAPDGHEEADRVFVGGPHGLRDARHLRVQRNRACRARSSRCSATASFPARSSSSLVSSMTGCTRAKSRSMAASSTGCLIYASFFMLFTMANVGLPGTSGFVGEILTMVGGFQASTWAAAGAALGVIFSAVYMLTLYRRVVFGEMTNEKLMDIKDVTLLEFFILGLLAISAIGFGVFPGLVFDLTEGSTNEVLRMIGQVGQ
jgi:NADH-quinone oxidoreductase subunit M